MEVKVIWLGNSFISWVDCNYIDHVTKYLGGRHYFIESVKVRTTLVKRLDIYFQKNMFPNIFTLDELPLKISPLKVCVTVEHSS